MADSVFLPMPIETVETAREAPSLTYRLDLDKNRIVGKVDGLAAVQQAIQKAIITPRWKCLIYDNQYGSEIKEAIIAKDVTEEYVASVMEGFIRDALKPDTRILDVSDFTFEFEGDNAYIGFTASTIFGTTRVEGVV